MPQPAVIVEWYGPYGLAAVPGAAAEYPDGTHLLCMGLGDGEAKPYRSSIGHWLKDTAHVFPLNIPEDFADWQFYLGAIVSYRPGTGRTAGAWALLRALQPGRSLNNPEEQISANLQDLPDHGEHYCMSMVSWFYDQDDSPTDPPPGFPSTVKCNQYEGSDEWSVHPIPMQLVSAFRHDPEPLPEALPRWLEGPSPKFDRSEFFRSRTVYYPGAGDDGHPVSLCARAHAAHAFVYVDYGVPQETIRKQVHTFRGYEVEHLEEVSELTLRPGGWTEHIDRSELRPGAYDFASVEPFGLFAVLRRSETFEDAHGPRRLAILFVGGDGYATFDALYCQEDGTPAPFLIVIQDGGFSGNFDRFGAGGLLEYIARGRGVLPEWLLVGKPSSAWPGYRDIGATPERGGRARQLRRLFLREGSPVWQRLKCCGENVHSIEEFILSHEISSRTPE